MKAFNYSYPVKVYFGEKATEKNLPAGLAAKEYGLLIGSNLNEWSIYATNLQYTNMTEEQKDLFRTAYPDKKDVKPETVDTLIRLPMLKIMAHKADQNGAPVYAYVFTHEEDDRGSYHGAELPYVFNNNASDSELADKISAAWIIYARTGTPQVEGADEWLPYTRTDEATMILDDRSYLAHGHDTTLMKELEPEYIW